MSKPVVFLFAAIAALGAGGAALIIAIVELQRVLG